MKGIEAIKVFKEKFGPVKKELLEKIKKDNKAIATITKSLKEGAKTIPQISKDTGIDSSDVLWYITALKKYGSVEITGEDGSYKKYSLKGVK
jgi:predicted transcriptional regulator